jgi:hypothetical protein
MSPSAECGHCHARRPRRPVEEESKRDRPECVRRPHRGAPLESGHHFESQTIQRIQNVFGRTLRAKALVALWEAYPTHASHEGTFEFRDDGSRSLFEAVAVMTGLSPLVRKLEARLAADVE